MKLSGRLRLLCQYGRLLKRRSHTSRNVKLKRIKNLIIINAKPGKTIDTMISLLNEPELNSESDSEHDKVR